MAGHIDDFLGYIATRVRAVRQARGLTQEEFAELGPFDARFLRDVEGGKKDISVGTLVRLANALGVTPASLLRPTKLVKPKPGRPKKRP